MNTLIELYETLGKGSADELQKRIIKYVCRECPLGTTTNYISNKSPEDVIPVTDFSVEENPFKDGYPKFQAIYCVNPQKEMSIILIENDGSDKAFVKIFGPEKNREKGILKLEEISKIKLIKSKRQLTQKGKEFMEEVK